MPYALLHSIEIIIRRESFRFLCGGRSWIRLDPVRQLDLEDRSLSQVAAHVNPSSMVLNDSVHDREPETGASLPTRVEAVSYTHLKLPTTPYV